MDLEARTPNYGVHTPYRESLVRELQQNQIPASPRNHFGVVGDADSQAASKKPD